MVKELILMNTSSWFEMKKLEKMTAETIRCSNDIEKMARQQLDAYENNL